MSLLSRFKQRVRRTSIAAIVSLALAAVVTLVLLAFAALFYTTESARRWDELARDLAISADQQAVAAALPAWNFDDSQILAVMKSGLNHRDLYASVVTATANQKSYLMVRDAGGRVVVADKLGDVAGMLNETRPIRVGGQTIGVVSVYATPRYVIEDLRLRRVTIVGVILVLDVALVLSVYLFLWYLMLAPIRAVGQYATSVQAGAAAPARAGWFIGEIDTLNESIRQLVALLDSRYAALRGSQERLAIATSAAGMGIWDWDIVANSLVWDETMYRHFGVSPDRFGGSFDDWMGALHPDDFEQARDALAAALRGDGEYTAEFRIVRPDGQVRHIAAESLTFRDRDGRALRMVGVNYDITDQKVVREELLHHRNHLEDLVAERTAALSVAVTEAKAANRAKSVFLATMSHELRTPLNSVIGFARMMADSRTMSLDEKRNVAIIHRSGQHLLTLINDILELSKIEAGRVTLGDDAIDLGELLHEVIDMAGTRAAAVDLAIALDVEGVPSAGRTDGAKLRQVLLNLMSNAVKFAGGGSVTLAVRGSPVDGGHLLAFAVRDTGIGIAPEDQQRIFDPFVQVDNGSRDGSGLGLTISREFVRLMGGALEVESTPGVGSTFRFSVLVGAAAGVPLVVATDVTGLAGGERARRILVVDDNADGRKLLVDLLTPLGFEVDQADDGASGLAAIAAREPELVFMDWRMPGVDGIEATCRLRADTAAFQPRVVMLTASAFEEERLAALAAGADDFLRKPVDHDKLFLVIEQQLGVHFNRRQRVLAPARATPIDGAAMARLPLALRGHLRMALQELDLARVTRLLAPVHEEHAELASAIERLLAQHHYPELCRLIDDAATLEATP
jgi:PAS domain S-box-containing protein